MLSRDDFPCAVTSLLIILVFSMQVVKSRRIIVPLQYMSHGDGPYSTGVTAYFYPPDIIIPLDEGNNILDIMTPLPMGCNIL